MQVEWSGRHLTMSNVTPSERRKIRLRNDFATMENIRTPWLSWVALRGTPPFVEQYELKLRLRTIIGPRPTYRDTHVIHVSLSPEYPAKAAPLIQMVSDPPPFHPNWFSTGRWCYGTWLVYESLGQHVVRMIQTLQYNKEITNETSLANGEAGRWYMSNLRSGLFPCDSTPLPDPTGAKISSGMKKKFEIK